MPNQQWWLCRTKRLAATCRLYCFPHSGGAPGEYLRFCDRLPDIEVWGLQLPGRGRRFAEPYCSDLASLVAALVSDSPPQPPYAFFGHSLGALVAFETARELRARGISQPVRIFASAYPAPGIPYRRPSVRDLADEDLVAEVTGKYGDTFGAVSDDPELLASSVAAYRADFTMIETYQHAVGPPLDIPVTVCGAQDDDIDVEELAMWRSYTTAEFDLRMFPGGHFYFRDRRDEFLAVISGALAQPVGGTST